MVSQMQPIDLGWVVVEGRFCWLTPAENIFQLIKMDIFSHLQSLSHGSFKNKLDVRMLSIWYAYQVPCSVLFTSHSKLVKHDLLFLFYGEGNVLREIKQASVVFLLKSFFLRSWKAVRCKFINQSPAFLHPCPHIPARILSGRILAPKPH